MDPSAVPTLHKWRRRYEAEGEAGLRSRSRRPHRIQYKLTDEHIGWIRHMRLERKLGPHRIPSVLQPGAIANLVEACAPWFRPIVVTAIAVGADRAPLLHLTCRDVQLVYNQREGLYHGQVYLRDTKTDARPRSVAIINPVCRLLAPLVEGKEPGDRVFDGPPDEKRAAQGLRPQPMNRHQVRYWFEQARAAADLEHVRFKDLRHTWAVNADNAGLSLGEMAAGMGHSQEETTVRYAKRQVTLDENAARRVGREMGLDRIFSGAGLLQGKTG